MKTAFTSGQLVKFTQLCEHKGLNPERFQSFLQNGILADVLEVDPSQVNRDDLRKFLGLVPLKLRVVVNYDLTLEQMIVAGNYDWKNDDITTERFPMKGDGKKEMILELVHFDRITSSVYAIVEMYKQGLRPATIEELLALGATFPDLQREFPIVALGSVAGPDGNRNVVCLDRGGSERGLGLVNFDDGCPADWRFPAIRK